jgi:hypothetical protein
VVELSRLGAQPPQLSPFILAQFGFRCGRIRLRRVRLSWIRPQVLGHDPMVKRGVTRGIIRER